jgi:hypothetical protein
MTGRSGGSVERRKDGESIKSRVREKNEWSGSAGSSVRARVYG